MIPRIAMMLLVLAAPSFAAESPADTVGTLHGRVLTPDGKGAGFANVLVLQTRRGAQADEDGRFRITLVPLGPRTLSIHQPGYASARCSIDVKPGDNGLGNLAVGARRLTKPIFVERPSVTERVAPGELVAEIVPAHAHWKVYEPLEFSLRIRNLSARPIMLLRPSPRGWEEGAKVDVRVAAPFDAFVQSRAVFNERPSGEDPAEDDSWAFVKLGPGEWFEPLVRLPDEIEYGLPTRAGTYSVTFRYSTTGKRGVFTRMGETPELLDRLSRVPAVELTAKTNFKVDY